MKEWVNKIHQGDVLDVMRKMPSEFAHCCLTSPPYWGLRNYGVDGQIGLEETPEEYITKLVEVSREVKRVLRDDGTFWLNIGDSFWGSGLGHSGESSEEFIRKYPKQGSNRGLAQLEGAERKKLSDMKQRHPILKPKDLIGLPWKVAIALQNDGWWLRCDIIWYRPNAMCESMKDRPTRVHEYVFLLSKSKIYSFDHEAVKEQASQNRWGGHKVGNLENSKGDYRGLNRDRDMMPETRNIRSVWTIPTHPYPEAHFATFPEDLIVPIIKAGCPQGGIVLDPFMGSGTTAVVAIKLERQWCGIELNREYVEMANKRIEKLHREGIQRGFF